MDTIISNARLSDREHEVMLALASGETCAEIGERILISIKTVSTYRSRILEKTGLKNNVCLALQAQREGLVK